MLPPSLTQTAMGLIVEQQQQQQQLQQYISAAITVLHANRSNLGFLEDWCTASPQEMNYSA